MASLEFDAASGRDQFLQLLVTQLRHQDPLEPVGQEDFLQQLAQFSTVEGVEKLNASFADFLTAQQFGTGFNLAGKEVEYVADDSEEVRSGRVDAVSLVEGRVALRIGEQTVNLDQVTSVLAPAA